MANFATPLNTREIRQCNACGEEWVDGGDPQCPFCGSTDTECRPDGPDDSIRGTRA